MKLIIGNLKMNFNGDEVNNYIQFFKNKHYDNVYFAPSNIYLSKFIDNGLNCVSQDVSPFENGSYTGDVSCMQLKSIGINYSLVGHSERRKNYGDGKWVNAKVKALLMHGMIPVICIGENSDERNQNKTIEVLKKEIEDAFSNIDNQNLNGIIIAYEPVWAIGTGKIPTMAEIREVSSFIKNFIQEKYSFESKVLYGGSVNNDCINSLETIDNIDGYLVGGCSLKYEEFDKLINKIS